MNRIGVKALLELEGGLSGSAHSEWHGHPAGITKHVHQGEPSTVAEAMAFGVVENRQEQRLAPSGVQSPDDRTAPNGRRALAHHHDKHHRVAPSQRRIPLEHVHIVKPLARQQPGGDGAQRPVSDLVTRLDPGQADNVGVRYRVVPVDSQLGHHLGCGLLGEGRTRDQQSQHHPAPRVTDVGHRGLLGPMSRELVSASR